MLATPGKIIQFRSTPDILLEIRRGFAISVDRIVPNRDDHSYVFEGGRFQWPITQDMPIYKDDNERRFY